MVRRSRACLSRPVGALPIALAVALVAVVLGPGRAGADHGRVAPGAEAADLATQAEQWGDGLRSLAFEHQRGDAGTRAWLESRMVETAARRREALLALLERDPAAVRAAALPASVRAALPRSVQGVLEEDLEIEGDLRILHADGGSRSGHYWALRTPLGTLSLHWAGAEPKGRLTGDRVRVRGLRVGQAVALGAGEMVALAAAPLPNVLGAQSTLVILVNFVDKSVQPYTPAFANTVVFGATSAFYRENSFNQTWLTGIVRGWYTIYESHTVCNPESIAQKAEQAAAAAGVNVAAYPRRVYAFPENACQWWGLGSVGGYPSQSWVRGLVRARGGRSRDRAQLRPLPLPRARLRRRRRGRDVRVDRVRGHRGHHGHGGLPLQRAAEGAAGLARRRQLAPDQRGVLVRDVHALPLRDGGGRSEGAAHPARGRRRLLRGGAAPGRVRLGPRRQHQRGERRPRPPVHREPRRHLPSRHDAGRLELVGPGAGRGPELQRGPGHDQPGVGRRRGRASRSPSRRCRARPRRPPSRAPPRAGCGCRRATPRRTR